MKTINKIAAIVAIIAFLGLSMSFLMKPDYANSSVAFNIKNAGIGVNGNFKQFETSIDYNESVNAPSSIKASIETNSIDTGVDARDKHLRKEEFFDVEKFPKITFESSKIMKLSTGGFVAEGKLTIKNTTRDISIPFTYTGTADGGVFEGTVTLNRMDYGVGGKSLTMGDDVTVTLKVTASK